jgi:hypothetical protein
MRLLSSGSVTSVQSSVLGDFLDLEEADEECFFELPSECFEDRDDIVSSVTSSGSDSDVSLGDRFRLRGGLGDELRLVAWGLDGGGRKFLGSS